MAIEGPLPTWFETDKIFMLGAGWYFGSRDGLHVGPYASYKVARAKGEQVGKRLRRLSSSREQLRFVRKILHKEWEEVGAAAVFSPQAEVAEQHDEFSEAVRAGEPPRNWYRSGRFYNVDGVWFFSTREGIDVGPFPSERDARRGERRLVGLLKRTGTPEEAYRTIYEYKHRPSAFTRPVRAAVDMLKTKR